jgi:endo-1,4-beta-xylanase
VPFDFHDKTLSEAEWWVSTAAGTGDLLLDDASLPNGA